jgi:hypothetical protein
MLPASRRILLVSRQMRPAADAAPNAESRMTAVLLSAGPLRVDGAAVTTC